MLSALPFLLWDSTSFFTNRPAAAVKLFWDLIYGPSLEVCLATFSTSFGKVIYQAGSYALGHLWAVWKFLPYLQFQDGYPVKIEKKSHGYTPNNKLQVRLNHIVSVESHSEILKMSISIVMDGFLKLSFLVSYKQLQVQHMSKLANHCSWPSEWKMLLFH